MVSQTITQVYQAWSYGGGQATRERQEAAEEQLRTQLEGMLMEKYNRLAKVAEKYVETLTFFDKPVPSGPLLRSVKDQYKYFLNMDTKERVNVFGMTAKHAETISASLLFGLSFSKKSNVAQLSEGFNVHGPNRYMNPKLMKSDPSQLLIDGTLSRRRTCRNGVDIPAKPLTFGRMELICMRKFGAIDAKASDGSTALMMAATTGNMIFVHYLLEAGANPYLSDRRGNTALHYAAQMDHEHVAACLISVGADPFAVNNDGIDSEYTARLHVHSPGKARIVRMLQGAKAVWLRVARGLRESNVCQAFGTRCAVTAGTPAESIISCSSGYCAQCGTVTIPTVDHEDHWPAKYDGRTEEERFTEANKREMKLRTDADSMEFWLKRLMRPLNHVEIASIPNHRIMRYVDVQETACGYPGTTVGGFVVRLHEKKEKKEKKLKPKKEMKIVDVHAQSTLLPLGWRCLSFVFRQDGEKRGTGSGALRVRKNPEAKNQFIKITATVGMDDSYLREDKKTLKRREAHGSRVDTKESEEEGKSKKKSTRVGSKMKKKIAAEKEATEKKKLNDEATEKAKKERSAAVRARFRSKVKTRMALNMFTKVANKRQDSWREDEKLIFGEHAANKMKKSASGKGLDLSPSPMTDQHKTLSVASINGMVDGGLLGSSKSESDVAGHSKTLHSPIKAHRVNRRSIAIPIHSTSVVRSFICFIWLKNPSHTPFIFPPLYKYMTGAN